MNTRRTIVLGTAAVASAALIAGSVAGALSASAAPTTHTIKFVASNHGQQTFGTQTALLNQVDRSKGKVVGYTVLHEHFGKSSGLLTGAVALQGGLIYVRIPAGTSNTVHGKVVGGTGAYADTSGTVTATSFGPHGSKADVVIHYHH